MCWCNTWIIPKPKFLGSPSGLRDICPSWWLLSSRHLSSIHLSWKHLSWIHFSWRHLSRRISPGNICHSSINSEVCYPIWTNFHAQFPRPSSNSPIDMTNFSVFLDQHFLGANILKSKFVFDKKMFKPQICFDKIFWPEIYMVGPKYMYVWLIFFLPKIVLDLKIFSSLKFGVQKILGHDKLFDSNIFCSTFWVNKNKNTK